MLLPIRLIVIVGVGVSLFVGSATAVGPSRQDRHYRNLQQPWIGERLECSGQTNEKKDLTKELQNIQLLTDKGENSRGVFAFPPGASYRLPSGEKVPGDSLIVKLLDMNEDSDVCEVNILRRIGLLRDWGIMEYQTSYDEEETLEYGVLVMDKVPGKSLHNYDWWARLEKDKQREILEKALNDLEKKVYGYVAHSGFLYADLTMDNMLVEIDTDAKTNTHSFKEAHLVDFGHEGIYTLRPGIPSKEVFDSWFYERINIQWAEFLEKEKWAEFRSPGTFAAASGVAGSSGAGRKRPADGADDTDRMKGSKLKKSHTRRYSKLRLT
ncbi:uncharacterized protein C8R40DRAFT_596276 [Lentinula edodes]|uniref:uncharacterized protein n=1 Tax=Lentinula edodes TaxID=5353 RepID=UPI001E8EDA84|nr:uncharacterized protein C8R40DRAFT_596276 [Lentinula edodes]KAH7879367.1 hypothetical protein C8R40DRAFT_596276 [Lentinula edodes]